MDREYIIWINGLGNFKVEKVTLCTGHEVYHATPQDIDSLNYGEGKTIKDAINDLIDRL